MLVQANYYARRYDEAVRTGRIAIELTPDSPYTCFYLALSLTALGIKDEAWNMANKGRKLNDGLPLGRATSGMLPECWDILPRPAAWSGNSMAAAKGIMARHCPLPGLILDWVKQPPPSNGWRQLWSNTIRSWDRQRYSPRTTRSAIKQDSCG